MRISNLTARSAAFAGVLAGVLAAQLVPAVSAAQSHGTNPPYIKIESPETVTTADKLKNKIEVVEVFSYGCIHCAHFQPMVDAWRKRNSTAAIEFVYLPATFNPYFELVARGFYAASSLGVMEKTHQAVFDAIHVNGTRILSFDDVVALYEKLGVPRADFVKAAHSFLVETQVHRANDLMIKYHIEGTPTLVVAGKYQVNTDSAGSAEAMFKVVDQVIAQESASSRQAPKSGK